MRIGTTIRKRKAGKISGSKKRRVLPEIPVKDDLLFAVFLDNGITPMAD
jgi:hypothetical protein